MGLPEGLSSGYSSLVAIVLSFAPSARDTELLALRFETQRFRFCGDHPSSIRLKPLQCFPPTGATSWCRGSEQSKASSRATSQARSEKVSPSCVLRFLRAAQPTPDSLCEPPGLSEGACYASPSCRTQCF